MTTSINNSGTPPGTAETTELQLGHELRRLERIPTRIFLVAAEAAATVANEIAALVKERGERGCVLGLSVGSEQGIVFDELVSLYAAGKLSFRHVTFFCMDEYIPSLPSQWQSRRFVLNESLFRHVDADPERTFFLNGSVGPGPEAVAVCDEFERRIAEVGGIDFMLLTTNSAGAIGFNDVAVSPDCRTRPVYLDKAQRKATAGDFFGGRHVPRQALSMGAGTVLSARRIVLMAFGEGRASITARIVEEPLSDALAISFLQRHNNATVVADIAAAAKLTAIATPWLLSKGGDIEKLEYTPELTRRAVIWLSLRAKKPILRLEESDYIDNQLSQLIKLHHGNVHELNLSVYHHLSHGMTGWPGGRIVSRAVATPPVPHPTLPDCVTYYEPKLATHKHIVIFSPHPDDDVISMGGTLLRLCDQGHEVHTVYQTSGNIAVFDDDALRFCNFSVAFLSKMVKQLGEAGQKTLDAAIALRKRIEADIRNKSALNSWADSEELLAIKGEVRRQDALSAMRFCGILPENVHFLDMPFYQTGAVRKNPVTDADTKLVLGLLREVKPHQIYTAGDLSDPHGTHRMCLKAVISAIEQARKDGDEWLKDCEIWLYRGAWEEWELERVQMSVPLSPAELYRKRLAIYRHQSQKDPAPFPGSDSREFWQRSEARNKTTAQLYDKLGLTEFEAMETFVRYDQDDVLCKALLN